MAINIGILALQGAFLAHAQAIKRSNHHIASCYITKPEQLKTIDGLIMPGGESTALLKLINELHFSEPLIQFAQSGKPIFGTCAGMILLAQKTQPEQQSLGLLNIEVQRNGYGRQINSFIAHAVAESDNLGTESLELVFIRAPKIINYNSAVINVLIQYQHQAVMVQQDNILAAAFHPELTHQTKIHDYFLSMFN